MYYSVEGDLHRQVSFFSCKADRCRIVGFAGPHGASVVANGFFPSPFPDFSLCSLHRPPIQSLFQPFRKIRFCAVPSFAARFVRPGYAGFCCVCRFVRRVLRGSVRGGTGLFCAASVPPADRPEPAAAGKGGRRDGHGFGVFRRRYSRKLIIFAIHSL